MSEVRQQRRAEIIAASRALIVESGLEGLSIGRLEKRLPYTRGVITHHFDSRDDIVDALLDDAIEEIDAATFDSVKSRTGFENQLVGVLQTKVEGFVAHPDATAILLAFWTRAHDARGRRVNQRLFARYREEAAQAFTAHPDPDALAALLVGTVIGLVLQVHLQPELPVQRAIRLTARSLAAENP